MFIKEPICFLFSAPLVLAVFVAIILFMAVLFPAFGNCLLIDFRAVWVFLIVDVVLDFTKNRAWVFTPLNLLISSCEVRDT